MHVYKCPSNCHVRVYPFWVGDSGEKCPKCNKEFLEYKGDKTQEQLDDIVRTASQHLIPKSKKNLKKRKKKK